MAALWPSHTKVVVDHLREELNDIHQYCWREIGMTTVRWVCYQGYLVSRIRSIQYENCTYLSCGGTTDRADETRVFFVNDEREFFQNFDMALSHRFQLYACGFMSRAAALYDTNQPNAYLSDFCPIYLHT